MAEKTLDEEIEEAMRLVDGSSPAEPDPPPPAPAQEPDNPDEPEPDELDRTAEPPALIEEEPAAATGTASPTLSALDEDRRPRPEIACGLCPNSVWFATPSDLRCYCRVMFVQTWTAQKPGEIVSCDGMFLGQD